MAKVYMLTDAGAVAVYRALRTALPLDMTITGGPDDDADDVQWLRLKDLGTRAEAAAYRTLRTLARQGTVWGDTPAADPVLAAMAAELEREGIKIRADKLAFVYGCCLKDSERLCAEREKRKEAAE